MKKKYKTVKELAEAFKTGELDRDRYVLILDNDHSFMDDRAPRPEGITDEEWQDEENKRWKFCQDLFEGNGQYDLQEALEAAGIPCESC